MGAVYLAEDQRALGRHCVIKELLPSAGPPESPEALAAAARFEEEARILTRLRHPNTPQVYAFIRENGRLFIAMEYISGPDLEQGLTRIDTAGQVIQGSPQPLEQILRDGIELCRILEYLARQSPPIVHHDIKPANLIRDAESHEVFLVDFGSVARPVAGQQGITIVYGTPGYAAPECYRGMSDPRSDVYALAATLYHLLTDDDPREHPLKFPRLDSLPPPVAEALRSALNPNLAERCDAAALRSALERCLQAMASRQSGGVQYVQLGVEPLIFPGGERPTSPQEFARACFRWWNFALGLLHDGKVSAFLRGCGMADLADWLQQSQGDASPDAVLDALLRRLEPGLPPPAVEPSVQHISLGVVTPGLQTAVPLLLLSRGGLAQVAVTSALPWLQFYPEHLLIRPGEQEQVQLCASPDYASHGQIRGSLQLQVYDAQARLVSTQKVEVSAEVGAGTRARPGRVDMLWLLMILTSALVVLMLLWTLRPPGWSLLSVICVGLTAGGVVGWVLNGAGDLSLLLMHTLLGALGAIAGGLIVPLFILKRALPLLSAGQMAGALLGAVLAPLLVHLFFES